VEIVQNNSPIYCNTPSSEKCRLIQKFCIYTYLHITIRREGCWGLGGVGGILWGFNGKSEGKGPLVQMCRLEYSMKSFFYHRTGHGSFIAQKACIRRDIPWQLWCSGQRLKKCILLKWILTNHGMHLLCR